MSKRTRESYDKHFRLIAAAPELLDALKDLLDYTGGAATALDDEYVMERARAAIARAEGGQS